MHTLISFLGKAQTNYRTAVYDFEDSLSDPTQFFGLAALKYLHPENWIMLGTSGSMWDVFVEYLPLGDAEENTRLELIEKVKQDCVSQELLNRLSPLISQALKTKCHFVLIQYGRNSIEQVQILENMAQYIPENSFVSLDLTHGLRHLPMLGFMSALYLRTILKVEIAGIYSGALDMTANEKTPVLRLDGLLQIADWAGGVQCFDKNKDYGVFAPLLNVPELSECLKEASFLESVNELGRAKNHLQKFINYPSADLPAIAKLFFPQLQARIDWTKEKRLHQRQQSLAAMHLENGEYMLAAILGYESFITRLVQAANKTPPDNFDIRNEVKKQYENDNKKRSPHTDEYQAYCILRDLRNKLVHGSQTKRGEVLQGLENETALKNLLKHLYNQLNIH